MSKIKPVVNTNEQYFDILFYKVNNTYLTQILKQKLKFISENICFYVTRKDSLGCECVQFML